MHPRVAMESDWSVQPTADGSFTFACTKTGRAFHSRTGAYREALGKFVRPSGLLYRPEPIRVLDVCYGLGYNSAALLDTLWRVRPTARVLQTRAAIPYRDPTLTDDAPTLYRRRREEQQCSNLAPSSHWKKRWTGR
ncbi:hypothetical protein [Gloeobacter violaceus]|uniref:hypothetical protein n=1 Tax=Gloeobacter violaceus TaxID=33072 RepID=UPI0018D45821|nr:hypothetical protein [Gloeobacter violaceus]